MADEDIESGGQTEDSGDTGDDSEESSEPEATERQAAAPERDRDTDRPSRKERRANRMREAMESTNAAKREAAEARQRAENVERQLNEYRREQQAREQASRSVDQEGQRNQRIASLRKQARDQLVLASQLKGPEAAEAWDRHQQLMDEADDLRAEGRWEKRRGEISQQMPNQDMLHAKNYIQIKYPQVATNSRLRGLADGTFADLVGSGRPANMTTMEEAITFAMKTLRIGGNNGAPNPARRNAYIGTGQRDGEADGDSDSASMSVDEVRQNLGLRRLAQLAYPNLEAEQAYAKFARNEGSRAKRTDA